MLRRRIGGVVVIVVEDDLGEHAKKKTIFTQEKNFASRRQQGLDLG
jgi:hypothetical protein